MKVCEIEEMPWTGAYYTWTNGAGLTGCLSMSIGMMYSIGPLPNILPVASLITP